MYQMFLFSCTIYKCKIYSFVNLFATLLYYSQSLSLILTVAVAGSVVAINVLLTKRTVPTMSGSQAMPLLLLDNKPGMQSCSDELPALNRKTAVRVRCSVSSPSNTLSAGRITYHIALLAGNVTDCYSKLAGSRCMKWQSSYLVEACIPTVMAKYMVNEQAGVLSILSVDSMQWLAPLHSPYT